MNTSTVAAPRQSSGRLFLVLGLGLATLGVIGYVVQLSMQRLMAPWYLPLSATLGVVSVAFALWKTRTVWRVLSLLLVMLLASLEWTFLVVLRLPAYTGPIETGKLFPTFATSLANGASFTERNLRGEQNSVLVFFRGRW